MDGVPDYPYFSISHLCDQCVEQRRLPKSGTIIPEEVWESDGELRRYETAVTCVLCFERYAQQEIPSGGAAL
jgi:hypothetical protein